MSAKRLAKEFQELTAVPVNYLSISLENDNLLHWNIILHNLIDTPFEGGSFELEIKFTVDYPFKPPVIHFKTKIYHPNVSENGDVCLAIIKQEEWKPSSKMSALLDALLDLIKNPNTDDALESDIAQLYTTDRVAYNNKAKEWVKKYATTIKK